MNIKFNSPSPYTAPNNKPKVAFGKAVDCMKALKEVQRFTSSGSMETFQVFAKTIEPHEKDAFLKEADTFLAGEGIKPIVIKLFNEFVPR